MSYWSEYDAKRQAERDFERGRRDSHHMMERHWSETSRAYAEEYERHERDQRRREEERREQEEYERRQEERARWEAEQEAQSSPWINVTKDQQPPKGCTVVYWHKGQYGGMGYMAIADEWSWDDHGEYASHYLPASITTPQPEQR